MFTISKIIEGYLLDARARRLSDHTILDYTNTFRKFTNFLASDPDIETIDHHIIAAFLAEQDVSKKTLLNYHVGLSVLWNWAVDERYALENPLRRIQRPKPETRAIVPFSETDIRAMLNALQRSKTYVQKGTTASHRLPNVERNRAIILLLLDTGIRADELCQAHVRDLDMNNLYLKVFGKGSKERILPICNRTAQVIWKYHAVRKAAQNDPLFATDDNNPLDRFRLLKQLHTIGERASVHDVHPHRFRHTFAINFLRFGGNVYTLQALLGHTTLDMCKKYLNIAQADIQTTHRLASPVANLRL